MRVKINLLDFADNTYQRLKTALDPVAFPDAVSIMRSYAFAGIVNDDDTCFALIRAVMKFEGTKSGAPAKNKHRASHILVTWLLGVGLGEHLGINGFPSSLGALYSQQIWLQTAMLHDYGYFYDELRKKEQELSKLTGKYDLLTDRYDIDFLKPLNGMSKNADYKPYFTYTYDEIKNYYRYSQAYHAKEKSEEQFERNDHGIVGGCIAFREYGERIARTKQKQKPSAAITTIQKISCLTTASHNMYKSSDPKTDAEYRKYGLEGLTSAAPKRITQDNNLLLLLSLVDTIECTKRFSRKENKSEYLIQKTTLANVEIEMTQGAVTVDFSKLYDHICKRKENQAMLKKLRRHVKGVEGLGAWTSFCAAADADNEYRVRIK